MNIENIIFDLDGTLLDTTEGVLESAVHAAQMMGYEILPFDTMLKFVGPPIQNSFMRYYNCDIETAQKAANLFRNYYKEYALFKAKPYEGIYTLCDRLRMIDKRIAVATYKREDYALTILKHFGMDKYCTSIHGADNENVLSKADIVNLCIQESGGNKDNSVLVGDTIHDATGALEAGIPFIAVTYGFGFKTEHDAMKFNNIGIARSPMEVFEFIYGG